MRRASSVGLLVAAWLVTRGLVVWLLRGRHSWVEGDLAYYTASLDSFDELGLGRTLVEYPLPGVVVVAVPWLLAGLFGSADAYGEVVLLLSLGADAAFTVLLAAHARTSGRTAVAVWLLAVPLLGATAYARFDLVPGLLAGAGLLLAARRPGVAAVSAALATGLKLWPALVLPALAVPRWSRRAVVVGVAAVGAVLAAATVAVAGWGRLVSPLTWQAERGLQIESVAATPAMLVWAFVPGRHAVGFTEHNAFEVAGPGVGELLLAAQVLTLVAVVGLLLLWGAALRRGDRVGTATVAWMSLAAVGGFMVTSKVLSPQYLLWLLPLAAAATAVSPQRSLRAWAGLLLVATGLTQVVFPELYGHLTGDGELTRTVVVLLAVRNALLLALVVWAVVAAVRGVSATGRSPASHRGPRGTTPAPAAAGRPTET